MCWLHNLFWSLMTNTNLKLLGGWFSPFVLRVKIALNIKSLEYEHVEETLNPKSQLLLQSNPVYKKIPVLLHGDRPICESGIILEYIDELLVAMRNALREEDEEARKAYLEEIQDSLVIMEGEMQTCCREGEGYFGGKEIGLVDITFGSLLCWVSAIETMNGRKMIVEEKHPCLVKWAERFGSDPKVTGLIPETEKLIEFAKALQIKWKAAASTK